MSITHSSPQLETALANLTSKFRARIIDTYLELKFRYSKSQHDSEFDSSGISSGKFCETALRFLQHELTGTYIPFGQHIRNFSYEIEELGKLSKISGNESMRIIIPRALLLIYTVRNKRGIGHVGGDIEANKIDSATIVRIADWVICELIRIYHGLSIEEAQDIVDALATRVLPDVWEVNGKKRVLRKGLDFKQQVLLLVYSETQNGVAVEDLFSWTQYSNHSMFKRNVILPLHKDKYIEYDAETRYVHISPLGIKEVEEKILTKKVNLPNK
ncbi:hypothetical protein ACAW74_22925 [Fibrella sp. WM1]|uniref:hypothetical protein n=1 Tax=Fibrella musci TaxID=3242485 RepID=UPI003521ED8B